MKDKKTYLSPETTADAFGGSDEEVVAVFVQSVEGWILQHARHLASPDYQQSEHAGFAILMLISSYFEAVEPIFMGKKEGKSHEVHRAGLRRVFPELMCVPDDALDTLYGELRCGLYHSFGVGPKIEIARSRQAWNLNLESAGELRSAVVDPWEVLDQVSRHFAELSSRLRNPMEGDLRKTFFALRGRSPHILVTFFHGTASKFPGVG